MIYLVTIFPFIFCFKKQLYIFEAKKLVWQPKIDTKIKTVLKTQFVKEIDNMQKTVFKLFSF